MPTDYRLDTTDGNTDELFEGSDPMVPLPKLPEADWPEPIKPIISYATTPAQKDIMFLGAVTVLGTSMGKIVRCSYGGRLIHPCLQTFIVAPPASGKGIISLLRLLVQPIHDRMRRQYENELTRYQNKKAAYDSAGKEKANMELPQRPLNKMFLIAGNNTGTGILQNIMDAGGRGLIFEPEADTLSTAIGSEYGRFSDTLRKCFDHDRLTYNRRTDQEYREVEKSFLGLLISGTPGQVRPLIPSAENGLFSRQLYYYLRRIHEWQDQFDRQEIDLEEVFKQLGKEWAELLKRRELDGIYTMLLSEKQKSEFNGVFRALFRHTGMTNGYEMNSSVVRLAINICRILSVIAFLRGDFTPAEDIPSDNIKDNIVHRWDMTVSDSDFQTVMGMVEPLYRHATHILSLLPRSEVSRRSISDRDSFFSSLPPIFTRQMVLEKAEQENINANTALSWINRMVKNSSIKPTGNNGEYSFCYEAMPTQDD